MQIKNNIKGVVIFGVMLLLSGCSAHQLRNVADSAMISLSGNSNDSKGYNFVDARAVNTNVFETEDFKIKFPLAKQQDWSKMGGWITVLSSSSATVILEQNPFYEKEKRNFLSYHLYIKAYITDVTDYYLAAGRGDIGYFRSLWKMKGSDNWVKFERLGKENYQCMVNMRGPVSKNTMKNDKKYGKKRTSYYCYKFNAKKTKVKTVKIELLYQLNPSIPDKFKPLAEEYSFEEFKLRVKQTLDSLYIKDGWDESFFDF